VRAHIVYAFSCCAAQKSRYDKIQHVRQAAVRALAQLGAVHGAPAATAAKTHAARRNSRGSASSAGRGSAMRCSPSENSPPCVPSPKSAAGSTTAEPVRSPLASSFNRPRVRRPGGGGKHPQALDFGVEVFVPPGTPPHAVLSGNAEQPGHPENIDGGARAPSPAASATEAGTGGHLAAPSPDDRPSAEVPERQSLPALTVAATAPAAEAEPDKGHILRPPAAPSHVNNIADGAQQPSAEALASEAHDGEAHSPAATAGSRSASAGASAAAEAERPLAATSRDAAGAEAHGTAADPDFIEHRGRDGLAVRMRPSTAELDLQLEDGYTGYGTFNSLSKLLPLRTHRCP